MSSTGPAQDPVQLRPYEADDFEAVYRLDELCFTPEFRFSRASMRRFLQSSRARALVAQVGIELAGIVLIHVERAAGSASGYVVTLDVHPAFTRRGIATALLRGAETQALHEGCRAMLLHVFVGNRGAITFYESMGYKAGHTVEDFYGPELHALVYRKLLEPTAR
jgi:ribosomal-protein-alanine N-acetyltransferase